MAFPANRFRLPACVRRSCRCDPASSASRADTKVRPLGRPRTQPRSRSAVTLMSAALTRASPCIVARRPRPSRHSSRARHSSSATVAMASSSSPSPETTVVSAEWLKANIGRPDVVVLDCSWYLPAMERDPRAEHEAKRVPGARFFDVDGVSDPSSPLPHMLPDAGAFAAACDAVGVANGDQVVVYDGAGLFSAARGWWMFKVFGHDAVPIAAAADACARWYDDASNAASTPSSSFRATLRRDLVLGRDDVLARCVGEECRAGVRRGFGGLVAHFGARCVGEGCRAGVRRGFGRLVAHFGARCVGEGCQRRPCRCTRVQKWTHARIAT